MLQDDSLFSLIENIFLLDNKAKMTFLKILHLSFKFSNKDIEVGHFFSLPYE